MEYNEEKKLEELIESNYKDSRKEVTELYAEWCRGFRENGPWEGPVQSLPYGQLVSVIDALVNIPHESEIYYVEPKREAGKLVEAYYVAKHDRPAFVWDLLTGRKEPISREEYGRLEKEEKEGIVKRLCFNLFTIKLAYDTSAWEYLPDEIKVHLSTLTGPLRIARLSKRDRDVTLVVSPDFKESYYQDQVSVSMANIISLISVSRIYPDKKDWFKVFNGKAQLCNIYVMENMQGAITTYGAYTLWRKEDQFYLRFHEKYSGNASIRLNTSREFEHTLSDFSVKPHPPFYAVPKRMEYLKKMFHDMTYFDLVSKFGDLRTMIYTLRKAWLFFKSKSSARSGIKLLFGWDIKVNEIESARASLIQGEAIMKHAHNFYVPSGLIRQHIWTDDKTTSRFLGFDIEDAKDKAFNDGGNRIHTEYINDLINPALFSAAVDAYRIRKGVER